jgi:hypothetical protein
VTLPRIAATVTAATVLDVIDLPLAVPGGRVGVRRSGIASAFLSVRARESARQR